MLPERKFEVGDKEIVVKGKALGTVETSAFQSKLYGSCHIVVASHPQYELIKNSSRVSQ